MMPSGMNRNGKLERKLQGHQLGTILIRSLTPHLMVLPVTPVLHLLHRVPRSLRDCRLVLCYPLNTQGKASATIAFEQMQYSEVITKTEGKYTRVDSKVVKRF